MLIETSRRVSRKAVERVRSALIEYDRIAFKDVQMDLPAEQAFQVVRDGKTYVLSFEDPSVEAIPQPTEVASSWGPETEEWERDCGD